MVHKEKKSLLWSSAKMSVATLSSRVLGLVREQVMAHYFGASAFTDAFLVAYRIPNLLRDLFAEGAFSMAFVPTFTEARQKSEREAQELFWSLFLWLGLITALIGVIIYFFAPYLINLFAPEFIHTPEKYQIAVKLTQIMAPFLFLVSITALFVGALNSLKFFFVPALSPAFFNLVSIALYITLPTFLASRNYPPIYALGIGVTVAGLLQGLPLLHLMMKRHFYPVRPRVLFSPWVKKVFHQLGPGMIGIAATQINLLISTILASSIVGAVSWLNYAFRLFQFPVGVLSVSLAGSNLVHFSDLWKKGDRQGAIQLLQLSYYISNLSMGLALVGLISLSYPIVEVIFETGGKFKAYDTQQVSLALRCYALGLPFYGLYKLFVPIFYAMDRERTAIKISMASVLFNIIFCATLVKYFGFPILALGTTLSVAFNALCLAIYASRFLELHLSFFLNRRFFKILFSCFVITLLGLYGQKLFWPPQGGIFLKMLQLSLVGGGEIIVFLACLYGLGERTLLQRIIKKR